MTIVEAFSCGTPVLASDIGSMKTIIEEGVNGLKFAVGDAHELAERMNKMFNSKDLIAMRTVVRNEFERDYSESFNLSLLLDIYKRLDAQFDMNFVIITPSFNQVEFLKRCIASIADQVTDEIVIHHHVQDGGSSDGTGEFLKAYMGRLGSTLSSGYSFSYERVSDDGMYDALNKGIEYALKYAPWQTSGMNGYERQPLISKPQISNSIFAWLNCDEQYLLGSLKKVFDYFKQCPNVDFLYGNTLHVNSEGKFLTYRKNSPLRKLYVRTDHLYIQSASTFFRASIF